MVRYPVPDLVPWNYKLWVEKLKPTIPANSLPLNWLLLALLHTTCF